MPSEDLRRVRERMREALSEAEAIGRFSAPAAEGGERYSTPELSRRIVELESLVGAADERLAAEREAWAREKSAMAARHRELQSACEDLQERLKEALSRLAAGLEEPLQAELRDARGQIETLRAALEEQRKTWVQERAGLDGSLREASLEAGRLHARMEDSERARAALLGESKELRARLAQFEKWSLDVRRAIEGRFMADQERLLRQQSGWAAERKALQDELAKARAAAAAYASRIDDAGEARLEEERSAWERSRKDLEEGLAGARAEAAAFQSGLEGARKALCEAAEKAGALESRLADEREGRTLERRELEAELAKARAASAALDSELAAVREAVQAAAGKTGRLESRLAEEQAAQALERRTLEEALSQARAAASGLETRLAGARAASGAAAQAAARLEEERQAWARERRTLEDSLSQAHSEASGLETKLSESEAKRGRLEKERDAAARDRKAAGDELAKVRLELSAIRKELASAQTQLAGASGLRPELEKAQEALRAASEKAASLEQRLAAERAGWEKERKALEEKLSKARSAGKAREPAPGEFVPPLPPGDPEEEPLPVELPVFEASLEDPAWSRVARLSQGPIARAMAHLRRLASARLPKGQLAFLRLAAGELAQARDQLTLLGRLFDDAPPQTASGDVRAVVEKALSGWAQAFRSRKISVVRKPAAPVPAACFEAESLRLALFQILRNAYEAMPRGGTLTVDLGHDAASGCVRVVLADSGRGFSNAVLADPFQPFASEKQGRLGIGLAVVRHVLRSMGGDADAGNGAKGAFVALRLPPPQGTPPTLQDAD